MAEFRLVDAGFWRGVNQRVALMSGIFLVFTTMTMFKEISAAFQGSSPNDASFRLIALIPGVLFSFIIFTVTSVFLIKHFRDQYYSFRLRVEAESITISERNTPDIVIRPEDIISIQEIPGKRLEIKVKSKMRPIIVPTYLSYYEAIRMHFAQWHPIEKINGRTKNLLAATFLIIQLIALLIIFNFSNRVLVLPASVFIIIATVGGFLYSRCSPHADKGSKRLAWFNLIIIPMTILRLLAIFQ
ncbi:MAG TPA: hypothetical protein VHR47_03850 [Bacillota bacterium]|nr:hypothetical protein [Bacillota bacterium]